MRKSVFDGSFYPARKAELENVMNSYMDKADPKGISNAFSYVSPHAGYAYSGSTAAFTYKAIRERKDLDKIDTMVIVGPNHTGLGKPIAVSMDDWRTPMGKFMNDKKLSKTIANSSKYIDVDELAHKNEHSIEVQLPFLQAVAPGKKAVFICMGDQSIGASKSVSKAIIESAEKLERNVVVVASSDLNHYESAQMAKAKDSKLLDALKDLDPESFNKLVYELNDSACGFGPITVAMLFAMHNGAKHGVVLRYCNSGDTNADYFSVVAYSSIAFV